MIPAVSSLERYFRVEAPAVVADRQHGPIGRYLDADLGLLGRRVMGDIGQRLLADPV
jgi:hypothetical protein